MAKVLVVDDEPKIQRAVQRALEARDHDVITAGSQEDAEAAVIEDRPDLLIVDVMMPEGTEGFHLVWKVRQMEDEELSETPIIMATGIHDQTELRFYPDETDGTYEPGEFLPVQDWIDKPIDVRELHETVARLTE